MITMRSDHLTIVTTVIAIMTININTIRKIHIARNYLMRLVDKAT